MTSRAPAGKTRSAKPRKGEPLRRETKAERAQTKLREARGVVRDVARESGERLRDHRIGPGFIRMMETAMREALTLEYPADQTMRHFFKQHPELGRRDRQMVAECVFDVMRHRRRYQHLSSSLRSSAARQMVLTSLACRKLELVEQALSEDELAWFRSVASDAGVALAPAVQLSLPDWLWEALVADFGEEEAAGMARSLLGTAALDLRVNQARTDTKAALARLTTEGLTCEAVAWMPTAIRLQGKPALERNPCFSAGEVEVQDAGSQWLAALVDAKRGQTVVDFCAGAGGKTLAMAAGMRDSGQIYAVDISSARLARLRPRLVRAGVSNIQPFAIDDESDPKLKRLGGRADRVLVDAPCSGTGTLRRNPDIKWRQSEASVRELVAKQGRILRAAAKLLKPGGRLVYATCSLLKAENEGVVSAFLAEHPNFALDNALAFERPETRGALEHLGITPETVPAILRLAPHRIDADGFAAAVMVRRV